MHCSYLFTRVYANSPLKTTLPEHTCKRSLSVCLSGSNTRGLVVEHLSLFSGGRKRYWWIGDVSTPCAAGTLITEKSNTHTVQTCNVLSSVRVCLRECAYFCRRIKSVDSCLSIRSNWVYVNFEIYIDASMLCVTVQLLCLSVRVHTWACTRHMNAPTPHTNTFN